MTTLASASNGLYEMHIPAGTVQHITVELPRVYLQSRVLITHHSGNAPLYFTRDQRDLEPGDEQSQMVTPSTWVEVVINSREELTLSLVSSSDAIISVARA